MKKMLLYLNLNQITSGLNFDLCDITGRCVFTESFSHVFPGKFIQNNIEKIPAEIYFLRNFFRLYAAICKTYGKNGCHQIILITRY